MDPSVWSLLPTDIVEEILASLPLKDLFRYRLVCKRWDSITECPSFLHNHSRLPPQELWLLMFTDPNYKFVFAHDPTQNRWSSISLEFLPRNIDNVTVAGALLCFRLLESDGSCGICICNPITGAWRKLPPMAGRWAGNLVGLVMDPECTNYKVVVQTKHGRVVRTEEFDSRKDGWRVVADCEANFTTGSAFCNGVLYFVTWINHNGGQFTCDGVHAYDVEGCKWVRIPSPLPYFYVCPHLVDCQGKLLMVGGFWVQSSVSLPRLGIRVWELEPKRLQWRVLHTMPLSLVRHILEKPTYRLFNCVSYNNLIYLSECKTPTLFVVFNISTKQWYCVETEPPTRCTPTFSWFHFTPRLNARV